MTKIDFENQSEGRYDRQQLIAWWDQRKVSAAHVIVAGAGALGNEALKLLALVGIGKITVIDFDVISPSNLARMVLFREQDVGRPKVEVAAERLQEINPEVEVIPIFGDLRFDLGLGDYREADLVLGCLDSVNARWALNRRCHLAGVEWIDGGISDFHGLIARYSPAGGACYECNFTQATYARFNRRYSCPFGLLSNQDEQKVPTTAITTSLIASLQVQQALMAIHGMSEGLGPGERLMVYLKPFGMVRDKLPYNSECLAHEALPDDIPLLDCSPRSSGQEAILSARQILPGCRAFALRHDFVASFECPVCQERQPVLRPKEKVYQAEARCPKCGSQRTPEILSSIEIDSPLAQLPLAQLGLPPREILGFTNGTEEVYLQIGR